MTNDQVVTTEQAAELLDVPNSTIRKWKTRGKAVPIGLLRGRGRGGLVPTYRLSELRPLAEAYHRRAATRRAGP